MAASSRWAEMTPAMSDPSPTPYTCLLKGPDSLYVSYFFLPRLSRIDWDDLAYRKELMKARGMAEGDEIQLGCQRFMLQPYGSKPYSYVLKNRNFVVRLSENMNPCCNVQFLSEGLWQHGIRALVRQFDLWAASVGLEATRAEVIARADWAFDFHLPQIDFDENSFVSLASKDAKHRKDGKAQTFTFGTGDKVVRVYDKCAEIKEASGKTFFYQLWGQSEDVWRVEFQLRGEGLKASGIKKIADLYFGQAALLRNLARKHTSLRLPSSDSNRSRWPLHPLWASLLVAIAALPHQGGMEGFEEALPVKSRLLEQQKSIFGHLKSIGTLLTILEGRDSPLSLDETLKRLKVDLMLNHYHPAEWNADLDDRRKRHALGAW